MERDACQDVGQRSVIEIQFEPIFGAVVQGDEGEPDSAFEPGPWSVPVSWVIRSGESKIGFFGAETRAHCPRLFSPLQETFYKSGGA